ncbi:hypothetical protein IP88_03035 [alpha proteobacterium AAP81b]|nr:hypothetical protein IP88_03035 [alpha proteobacterium AAP81b]
MPPIAPASPTPRIVLVYGVAGLIPFLAPPLATLVVPGATDLVAGLAAAYGALILSFLGGARWGLEIAHARPRPAVIGLAMLPTLGGLALLLLPPDLRPFQLAGLALLLGLHFLWDLSARGLPRWYPRLRTPLTVGAVAGLIAEAALTAAG